MEVSYPTLYYSWEKNLLLTLIRLPACVHLDMALMVISKGTAALKWLFSHDMRADFIAFEWYNMNNGVLRSHPSRSWWQDSRAINLPKMIMSTKLFLSLNSNRFLNDHISAVWRWSIDWGLISKLHISSRSAHSSISCTFIHQSSKNCAQPPVTGQ